MHTFRNNQNNCTAVTKCASRNLKKKFFFPSTYIRNTINLKQFGSFTCRCFDNLVLAVFIRQHVTYTFLVSFGFAHRMNLSKCSTSWHVWHSFADTDIYIYLHMFDSSYFSEHLKFGILISDDVNLLHNVELQHNSK